MTSVDLPKMHPQASNSADRAGRTCPADYRYPASVFDRPAELTADVLYVVGGLYGNLAALAEVERLAAAEHANIVFNGDFHWFDAEPNWFAEVAGRVDHHRAVRGNVETELARGADVGAGCGCAYPASVAEDTVRRSNEILTDLRRTAMALPNLAVRLGALPMHLVANVGGLRIGIVHGDATALAGWSFAHDVLDRTGTSAMIESIRRASHIDVFASTHTCLAVLRDYALPAGRTTVINNGAAGMPNFMASRMGVITRIARNPSPHAPLYGLVRDGVHIDAIPLAYDQEVFLTRFLARWPTGSAAHTSYFQRILSGPSHEIAHARPTPAAVA